MWKKTIGAFLFIGITLFFYSFSVIVRLRFGGSGSLVESKWSHYVMVEAESNLKLLPPSILDISKVFECIAVHWHTVAALHSYLTRVLGFWVTYGVKMMSLRHGWGWQPPQTASHIHIRHIHSVWARWYAVYRHMIAALHSYTQPTWLRIWGSGSLVESNDVIMSWLMLTATSNCFTATSNCFPHPS